MISRTNLPSLALLAPGCWDIQRELGIQPIHNLLDCGVILDRGIDLRREIRVSIDHGALYRAGGAFIKAKVAQRWYLGVYEISR